MWGENDLLSVLLPVARGAGAGKQAGGHGEVGKEERGGGKLEEDGGRGNRGFGLEVLSVCGWYRNNPF